MSARFTLKDNILWQLPAIGSFKSMSYCIRTTDGQHFIIDGGGIHEAQYLKEFIKLNLDGRVDAWFITHPHKSHAGAFVKLIESGEISVGKIIYSYLDPEIVNKYEQDGASDVKVFNNTVKLAKVSSVRVRNGDRLKLGKSIIKIISPQNLETTRNYLNNNSVIYKFNFKSKSILFLGDIDANAGTSLMTSYKDELKSDILQMSHHGYYGASNELYEIISPDICLWPTRKELWPDCSGTQTNESESIRSTYEFMQSLGITKHYISGIDGLTEIRF